MTKTLYFLLCVCLFVSCQRGTEQQTLEQVSRLVFNQPDSALTLLRQIQSPESLPAKSYADYSLLMTEALDRCDFPLPDTLLRVAADFYLNRKEDPIQAARTCYYLGRFNAETGYAKEAQAYYLKGIDLLEKEQDYRLKGLLHYYLGVLYREQELYENAIREHKKSYSYSLKTQNLEDIAYDLQEIGRDFSDSNQLDSALTYYSEILSIIKDTNKHKRIFATTYNDIAIVYRNQHDYKNALSYVNKALGLLDSSEVFISYLIKGKIYLYENRYDSATFYLTKSLQSSSIGTQKEAYFRLYQTKKMEQKLQEAIQMNDLFLAKQDTLLKRQQTEALANINKRYQYEQIIKKNNELKIKLQSAKSNLFLGLFLACIIIAGLVLAYSKMKKKKELQLRLQVSYSNEIKKNLEQTQEAIREQELFLNGLHKQEFKFRKQLFEETEAYSRIRSAIENNNCFISKEDEKVIIQTIDKLFDSFPDKLKALNTTQGNICFCYLLKLYPQLNNEQLAQMYNVSPRSIEQRKYRLKKELIPYDDKRLSAFLEGL